MPICVVCQGFYEGSRELTCSENCHEIFTERLIAQFGEYKKVVRLSTGIAYRVPTRDIIERGIRGEELDQYPVWEEPCHMSNPETRSEPMIERNPQMEKPTNAERAKGSE